MSTSERDDPTWQEAWSWVMREHEQPQAGDVQAGLAQWLQADPAHRKAHAQASRLWLLTGLVPPRHGDADEQPAGGDTPAA